MEGEKFSLGVSSPWVNLGLKLTALTKVAPLWNDLILLQWFLIPHPDLFTLIVEYSTTFQVGFVCLGLKSCVASDFINGVDIKL